MAFTAKILASGFVTTSNAAIYTSAAATRTYVKAITCFNANAATQTLILTVNPGTGRLWKRASLAINEMVEFLSDGETLELEAGAAIEAITTTASAVTFTITGVTET